MSRKLKFYEYTPGNDIRYRGPLSYRALMIIGWFSFVLGPVGSMLDMGMKMDPTTVPDLMAPRTVMSFLSGMSVAFVLIANYARILNNKRGYKRQILGSGAMMIIVCLLFYLLFYRYIMGLFNAFTEDPALVEPNVRVLFATLAPNGFIAFNVFTDIFLCSLTMFFMNYHPVRIFKGRSVILFRLMALLPILYEILAFIMKAMAAVGELQLPFFIMPLLPVKPPMTFIVFVVLALFIKTRERRFCKKGGHTHEEYQEFLKTNRNSLHFSVVLMICMFVGGILDVILNIGFSAILSAGFMDPGMENAEALMLFFTEVSLALGLGKSIVLIPLAPFMLLFSYTRTHKNEQIDTLIPVGALILVIFSFVEGLYQLALLYGRPF